MTDGFASPAGMAPESHHRERPFDELFTIQSLSIVPLAAGGGEEVSARPMRAWLVGGFTR